MKEEEDLQSAIKNLHSALNACTQDIIDSLVEGTNYREQALKWCEYANQLLRLTPSYAVPGWLKASSRFTPSNINNPERQDYQLLNNFLVSFRPQIRQPIMIGEAATLDIEELFRHQSDQFHLNQVFEKLISQLSKLIEADVIDNRIVDESLRRLNALFQRTKNGSLATVLMTMNFGRFFLNSFGGVLKANKYAKPIIESFEKEFREASKTVQQVEEATKKDMVSKLVNQSRMELFIESNPELQETISQYLPAPPKNEDRQD